MVLWLGWETADQSGGKDRRLIQDGGWRSCDFCWETADLCWEKKRIAGSDEKKRGHFVTLT